MAPLTSDPFQFLTHSHSPVSYAPARFGTVGLRTRRPVVSLSGPTSAALIAASRPRPMPAPVPASTQRVPLTTQSQRPQRGVDPVTGQWTGQYSEVPRYAAGAYTKEFKPGAPAYDARKYLAEQERTKKFEYSSGPIRPGMRGLSGMGDLDPAIQNIVVKSPAIAGGVLSSFAASGLMWSAAAIPIIGAVVAGVTLGLTALLSRKGGAQKEAATSIVNKIEPLLVQNRDGYLANPTPGAQAQAVENFNGAWQWVETNCGKSELGQAGVRCISERQRGGSAPWCPTGTGCDWFTLYLDPILNTPPIPDTAAPTAGPGTTELTAPGGGTGLTVGQTLTQGTVGGIPVWMLIAAGLLIVMMIPDDSGYGRGRR